MPKQEKFTNRMESISSVNSDVFSSELRVNRSVWRRLPFGIQCKINKMISELNEAIYYNVEGTYQEMMIEQAEQDFLEQQVAMSGAEIEALELYSGSSGLASSKSPMSASAPVPESDACIDVPSPEAMADKNDFLPSIDKKSKKN